MKTGSNHERSRKMTKNNLEHSKLTYGFRRCEFPLRITSTPPRPAAAITLCVAPKSTPTTDIFNYIVFYDCWSALLVGWCACFGFRAEEKRDGGARGEEGERSVLQSVKKSCVGHVGRVGLTVFNTERTIMGFK